MTWAGGRPHRTGDQGQRYEVTYRNPESDEPEKRCVFGWSESYEGATRMVDSIMLHPVWCEAVIKDRQAKPAPDA